jgi:hypothetical protein
MTDTINTAGLKVGQRYRIIFRNPTDRLPREMIATFETSGGDLSWWSLRPIAGTQELPVGWIHEVWKTEKPVSAPAIYRGEERVF